jgi:hypothetical protein
MHPAEVRGVGPNDNGLVELAQSSCNELRECRGQRLPTSVGKLLGPSVDGGWQVNGRTHGCMRTCIRCAAHTLGSVSCWRRRANGRLSPGLWTVRFRGSVRSLRRHDGALLRQANSAGVPLGLHLGPHPFQRGTGERSVLRRDVQRQDECAVLGCTGDLASRATGCGSTTAARRARRTASRSRSGPARRRTRDRRRRPAWRPPPSG